LVGWQEKKVLSNVPASSFFDGVQRFAGQVLGQAQRSYSALDRASGGWLPGGGTASPLTKYKQEGERKLTQQYQESIDRQSGLGHGQANAPYVGRPGELAEKGTISNSLDVLNRAGASPLGFITQNPNDLKLVKNYFTENPDVTNQYSLPVNMFLRYYTGIGAEGLKLSPEQGQKILTGIKTAQSDLSDPAQRTSFYSNLSPAYAQSYKQKIESGMIPVATPRSLPVQGEVNLSLGRHWAKPLPGGSYQVDEDFNFPYAPKNKEGSPGIAEMSSRPNWFSALGALTNPQSLANDLVSRGYGTPFRYRLNVSPSGDVQTQPLSGN